MTLRLTIDPVPAPSAGRNLATELPDSLWDKISKSVRERAGSRCQICDEFCNEPYQLDCHEEWRYEGKTRIQRLVGFVALCKLCHYVRHMRSISLSGEDLPDSPHVIAHFCRVNGCDTAAFYAAKAEASALYRVRSRHKWTIITQDYLSEYWRGQGWGEYSEALTQVQQRHRLRVARALLAAIEDETRNLVIDDGELLQEVLGFDDLLELDPYDPTVIADVAFNRLGLDDGEWDAGDYDDAGEGSERGYFGQIMSRD